MSGGGEPGFDCFPGPFGDLEAHGLACLALNDRSAVLDRPRSVGVGDLEPHQVAATQLAVDGEVEERQFSGPMGDLEADPDRPNLRRLRRTFLADDAPFAPSGTAGAECWQGGGRHGGSSTPPVPPRLRHFAVGQL